MRGAQMGAPIFFEAGMLKKGALLQLELGSLANGGDAVGRDALRKRLCTTGEFDRLRPDRAVLAEVSSRQLHLIDEDRDEPA